MKHLRELIPGRRVPLAHDGLVAVVYPLGISQIEKHAADVAQIWSLIAGSIGDDDSDDAIVAGFITRLGPLVATRAVGMVADCVKLTHDGEDVEGTVRDLPHELVPPIITAWVEETIGPEGEKIRPWMAALTDFVTRIGGGLGANLISEMRSNSSPSTDTDQPTSSVGTPATATQAGASGS